MNDGGTCILANRQDALGRDFGIAQHRQSDVFVVIGRFRIFQNLCYTFVMRTAKHEVDVCEGTFDKHRECFWRNFQDFFAFKITERDMFGSEVIILGGIFPDLEHRCIFELRGLSHSYLLCISL